jgi:hypothetical protein
MSSTVGLVESLCGKFLPILAEIEIHHNFDEAYFAAHTEKISKAQSFLP